MDIGYKNAFNSLTDDAKRFVVSVIERGHVSHADILMNLLDNYGSSIGEALDNVDWELLRRYCYAELILKRVKRDDLEIMQAIVLESSKQVTMGDYASEISLTDIAKVVMSKFNIGFIDDKLASTALEKIDSKEFDARFQKLFVNPSFGYLPDNKEQEQVFSQLIYNPKVQPTTDNEQGISEEEMHRRFKKLFNDELFVMDGSEVMDDSKIIAEKNTKRNCPFLEKYGRDLIAEARKGRFKTVVGRTEEVQLVIETLCRRSKRNPMLIGPSGIGKTAIVEKLAILIAEGKVPDVLRGARLFLIQPTTIVAASKTYGLLEENMMHLIKEASQEGVILFIDEIHTIIGAGGPIGTNDIASMMKPGLARGDVSCIAATTDEEFSTYVEKDPALERRFQSIRVHEPNVEETLIILRSIRDELSQLRGIQVSDNILQLLIDSAQQYLRNRRFPDKAVDLLEQCVAQAIVNQRNIVDSEYARLVVQRIVGMPLDIQEKLTNLKANILEKSILLEEDCDTLISSLGVTLRGFDVFSHRPNQVILLTGDAIQVYDKLSSTIAVSLYGSEERVINIDLNSYTHPADMTMIIGSPPGYVGYNDYLPIYRVAQTPWSVICFQNIHRCHFSIRDFIGSSLKTGFITDSKGRRNYLCESIVILTAELDSSSKEIIGFTDSSFETKKDFGNMVRKTLGSDFIDSINLICEDIPLSGSSTWPWIKRTLLRPLSDKYMKHRGLEVLWDDSLRHWCSKNENNCPSQSDWARLIDTQINTLLVKQLFQSKSVLNKVIVEYNHQLDAIKILIV